MKSTKHLLAVVLAALLGASLACEYLPTRGTEPTPLPAGRQLVFEDDFSDPSSGWDRVAESRGMTDYANGAYRITVNEENSDYWANPGQSWLDAMIEVDATKAGGPDDNDFGVICRYQGPEAFYAFLISSDGFAGIAKQTAEGLQFLGGQKMQPSSHIRQGAASNHIRVDCVGDKLTLYVNGQFVMQVEDTEYSAGDMGLIAGTFAEPGVDILFDNVVVYWP